MKTARTLYAIVAIILLINSISVITFATAEQITVL